MFYCDDCGHESPTAQGAAAHRRLAHGKRASSGTALQEAQAVAPLISALAKLQSAMPAQREDSFSKALAPLLAAKVVNQENPLRREVEQLRELVKQPKRNETLELLAFLRELAPSKPTGPSDDQLRTALTFLALRNRQQRPAAANPMSDPAQAVAAIQRLQQAAQPAPPMEVEPDWLGKTPRLTGDKRREAPRPVVADLMNDERAQQAVQRGAVTVLQMARGLVVGKRRSKPAASEQPANVPVADWKTGLVAGRDA